jgi:uncharacterized membrane protein
MQRSLRFGSAVYGLGMIGFGISSIVLLDGVPSLEPLPAWLATRPLLGVLSGALLIAAGAGLVVNRLASLAARCLGAFLLSWLVLLHLPRLVAQPRNGGFWVVAFEVVAICAVAWMLAAYLNAESDRARKDVWRRVGTSARLAFGVSFLAFGLSHFVYREYVASVIPAWIPAHQFFAYATGCAHVAAGLSLITRIQARLAATMLAVMFGSWVLVVHVPRVVAHANKDEWTSLIVAVAMCGGSWLVSACVAPSRRTETAAGDVAGGTSFRWPAAEPTGRRQMR